MNIKNNYLLFSGKSYYLGNSIKSFKPEKYIEKAEKKVMEVNGIFRFRYGPLTGGLMESHAWDIYTNGERIIDLVPAIGYKRRDMPFKEYQHAVMLSERIQGNFAISHAIALANGIEFLEGIEATEEAIKIRIIASELERIYNHLFLIVRELEAGSLTIAQYKFLTLYEKMLRLNGMLFGHRFMFGVVGVNKLVPMKLDKKSFLMKLEPILKEFKDLANALYNSNIMMDRLQIGYLTKEEAQYLTTGPSARGSFLEVDDRCSYIENFVPAHGNQEFLGSALSRVNVRIEEVEQSIRLINGILNGEVSCNCNNMVKKINDDTAISRIESPSGDLAYVVKIDLEKHEIKKVLIRGSSSLNILGFIKSITKNSVFTDFHFDFESFGIMIGELDVGENNV